MRLSIAALKEQAEGVGGMERVLNLQPENMQWVQWQAAG